MIEFGKGYKPNDDYNFELKVGEHPAMITHVKLGVSKKGNPTAYITLMINKKVKMFFYLPDDRSTMEACIESNARLTRFFDCFKITRGNFKIDTWLNKKGKVFLDYGKPTSDGNKYLEVKKLIVQTPKAPEIPPSSNSFKPPEDIHTEYDDPNDSDGYIKDIEDEYIEEEEGIMY